MYDKLIPYLRPRKYAVEAGLDLIINYYKLIFFFF